MGIITIKNLKPDMVLANDLTGANGRLLFAKGTRLTQKHLRTLKMWGVVEADIEGVSEADLGATVLPDIDPSILKAAEELTRRRFVHCSPAFSINHELFRLCALRKAGAIAKAKENGECPAENCAPVAPAMDVKERPPVRIDPVELIEVDVILSTLPVMVAQISETINNPTSTAKDIADIISADTSLAACLLKIVNSPMYGFPSGIDTLTRAVHLVGTKQLSALAMGLKIIRSFSDIPCDVVDMRSFILHSLAVGIVARIIAGYKNIQNVERLFVGGLLHDIGRMILYNKKPDEARCVLMEAVRTGSLLHKTEQDVLGCDHARIGGLLLKKWRLPVSLENMVSYHHSPEMTKNPLEPAIICLADIMVNALGMGSSGERFVPPLEPTAWENIGLPATILRLIIEQLDHQYEAFYRFLLSDDC
ncbi:MAG: HDOD domain-containing protein [Syntrophobacteraceae bacterium]